MKCYFSIAVGTSVARRPPHRSVQEVLLHTALTSGSSRKAFGSGIASRILSSPFNAYSRLRVQVADNCPEFPLGHRPFLRNLRHDMGIMPPCSAPSSVLRRCQTARQRPCKNYGHRPSLTVPPCNTTGAAELSRFSNIERLRMLRVSDSAGPGNDWLYRAATRGAFPTVVRGRHPEGVISELNGWPTLPLSTLHVQSHDRPRMTRGHNGAAPPFMWGTFTPCSMPVYPGAFTTSHHSFLLKISITSFVLAIHSEFREALTYLELSLW